MEVLKSIFELIATYGFSMVISVILLVFFLKSYSDLANVTSELKSLISKLNSEVRKNDSL